MLQPISSVFVNFLVMYRWGLYSNSQSKVYGRVTNDPGLLRRAMNDINGAFPYTYCSPPTQLIIATWIDYQKTDTRQVSIIMFNKIRTGVVCLYVHKYMYCGPPCNLCIRSRGN